MQVNQIKVWLLSGGVTGDVPIIYLGERLEYCATEEDGSLTLKLFSNVDGVGLTTDETSAAFAKGTWARVEYTQIPVVATIGGVTVA